MSKTQCAFLPKMQLAMKQGLEHLKKCSYQPSKASVPCNYTGRQAPAESTSPCRSTNSGYSFRAVFTLNQDNLSLGKTVARNGFLVKLPVWTRANAHCVICGKHNQAVMFRVGVFKKRCNTSTKATALHSVKNSQRGVMVPLFCSCKIKTFLQF